MNIKQAKNKFKYAVSLFREDELGRILIPAERQRPILLMPSRHRKTGNYGADRLNWLGLGPIPCPSYKQSALGLPFIGEKVRRSGIQCF